MLWFKSALQNVKISEPLALPEPPRSQAPTSQPLLDVESRERGHAGARSSSRPAPPRRSWAPPSAPPRASTQPPRSARLDSALRSPVERTRQRPHNMPWPSAMAVAPPVPGRQAYFRLFRSSVTVYSYPGRTTSIPPSATERRGVRACAYAVWGHARPPRTYSSTHAAMPCVSTEHSLHEYC